MIRHTTLGRTSLDEWSARRRELYLTVTQNSQGQRSTPRRNSKPQSQQALDCSLTQSLGSAMPHTLSAIFCTVQLTESVIACKGKVVFQENNADFSEDTTEFRVVIFDVPFGNLACLFVILFKIHVGYQIVRVQYYFLTTSFIICTTGAEQIL
jgi:hypothetical protein